MHYNGMQHIRFSFVLRYAVDMCVRYMRSHIYMYENHYVRMMLLFTTAAGNSQYTYMTSKNKIYIYRQPTIKDNNFIASNMCHCFSLEYYSSSLCSAHTTY